MPMDSLHRRASQHEPNAPALEVSNVSVQYDNVVALDHVSLTLQRGDQLAVVGPNGAGKSTLFHVIAGIVRPNSGAIRIYGSQPGGHICVGYVPQRTRLDANFPVTVRDVVMMGRTGKIGFLRQPGKQDREIVQHALEQVEMQQLAKRQIGELSGGQQQRIFLARALAQEAEILLLDEPLTGLDAPSQQAILNILDTLRAQGVTMLVATHDLNQASARFPLVALINRRLVAIGAPEQVFSAANLTSAFGSHAHVVRSSDGDMLVTDTCCSGDDADGHPAGHLGGQLPGDPVIGKRSNQAVAMPAYEVAVDGERRKGTS